MPSRSRRTLLRTLGAAAVGLAGCQEQTATTPTGTSTPTASATSSPTDSPTPTPQPLRCGQAFEPEFAWPLPERSATGTSYLADGAAFDDAPSVAWTVDPSVPDDVDAQPDDAVFARPVVAGDSLYVVRRIRFGTMVEDPGGHALQARDAATGDLRWSVDLPKRPTPPAVWGDAALVASRNDRLYAVDRGDGTERWTRAFAGNVDDLVPVGDRAYVVVAASASRNAELHALASDGTTTWSRSFDDDVESVAAGPDRVYAGLADGTVAAHDHADGAVAWRATTARDGQQDDVPVQPRTLVVTDCAVVALTEAGVFAFDRTGGFRWRADGDYQHLATDGRTLYGAHQAGGGDSPDSTLRAVDAGTGDRRWERSVDVAAYAPAVLTGGALYQPLQDGLVAVDPAGGAALWRTTPPLSHLALDREALYGVARGRDDEAALVAMR